MRVDGIPVYGKVHEISAADIREALKEHGGQEPAAQIDVMSNKEMHIYYRSREQGWVPTYHTQAAYGSSRRAWSGGWLQITLRPDALRFMETANHVFIFPVRFTELPGPVKNAFWSVPHRGDKHVRLITGDARRELVRLLSREKSWFEGFDDTVAVGREPRNVGFIFRTGKDEFVMFFSVGGKMEGAFKGEHTGGSLEDKPERQFENWKLRYAQPELRGR